MLSRSSLLFVVGCRWGLLLFVVVDDGRCMCICVLPFSSCVVLIVCCGCCFLLLLFSVLLLIG